NYREVDAVTFTEGLRVAVQSRELNRQAARRGEDGSERPAAENAADDAMLATEERWLVEKEDVVNEFAVERLGTVAVTQIEGVRNGLLARGLNSGLRAERFAPREVLLHRQAVPIGHFHGHECGVVVAVADAGVDADAGSQLTLRAECRAGDRCVHHRPGEVEAARV